MQLADLTIDQAREQVQQLVCVYENTLDLAGTFETAASQFERACHTLVEEGWRLKQVSHRGSILSPQAAIVATYEK